MYILLTMMRGGISIGGCGERASAYSLWDTSIVDVVPGLGLESHGAPLILVMNSESHFWSSDSLWTVRACKSQRHEFSCSLNDTFEHSELTSRFQLVLSVIVLRHHPNDFLSKRQHLLLLGLS